MGRLGNQLQGLRWRNSIRALRKAQKHRRTQFEALAPMPKGGIVFLGDSITEGGMWDEWFPDWCSYNRGISGETTTDLLSRMGTSFTKPRVLSLLIGTNDLSANVPANQIAANVSMMLGQVRRESPDTKLLLHAVFPRARSMRNRITELNSLYHRVAERQDAEYVDLWPVLALPDGRINPKFSNDELHLNGAGYATWVKVLEPVLKEILLNG